MSDGEALARYVADVNSDGKSDLIFLYKKQIFGGHETLLKVYLNSGIMKPLASLYLPPSTFSPYTFVLPFNFGEIIGINFGDFNGNGTPEMLFSIFSGSNNYVKIVDFSFDAKRKLLHSIKDGFNSELNFEYKTLTEYGSFYLKGPESNYPLKTLGGPFWAVSKLILPDGIGGLNQTEFSYEKGLIHTTGKGFLGFQKIKEKSISKNILKETVYDIHIPSYFKYPVTQSLYLVPNPGPFKITNFTHSIFDLSISGNFLPFLPTTTQIQKTDYLNGFTTNETFNFNSNDGNLINYTKTSGTEQITINNTWGMFGSWINNVPTQTQVICTRDGNAFHNTKNFIYNVKGKLISEVNFSGLPKQLTTQYTYWPTGLISSVTTSAAGCQSLTNSFLYDTKWRYIVETTNPIGQIEKTEYHPQFGLPIKHTGADGLETFSSYDAFGRLTSLTTPDNLTTTNLLSWENVILP